MTNHAILLNLVQLLLNIFWGPDQVKKRKNEKRADFN